VAAMFVLWALYGAFGHRVVRCLYASDRTALGGIVDRVMAGRSETPLDDYIVKADTLMLAGSLRALSVLALVGLLAAALRRPKAVLSAVTGLLLIGVGLFASLELRPSLAYALGLDSVDYYFYRNILQADADLVYRGKPSLRFSIVESHDARPFGVTAQRIASNWATDEEGFRNIRSLKSAEVVLLGDGMLNSGLTWADTLGARLENHLHGSRVSNLGISGHGPFQFIRTLEIYGISKRPKLAILAFNEGNDLDDIDKHMAWKAGSPQSFTGGYEIGIPSSMQRFRTALGQTWLFVRERCWDLAAAGVFRALGDDAARYPFAHELAQIRLRNGQPFPMIFVDRQKTESTDVLERDARWERFKDLVAQFKTICHEHHIAPAVLFVPTAAHIYAEYSTERSGTDWLRVRDAQIAAKGYQERAVANLSADLGLPFISLSGPFEAAASRGEVLYDSFSVHLTAPGAELAGAYVAGRLLDLQLVAEGVTN
jgi:hypothetical protein